MNEHEGSQRFLRECLSALAAMLILASGIVLISMTNKPEEPPALDFWVDCETGVNYIRASNGTFTPRLTESGEIYVEECNDG